MQMMQSQQPEPLHPVCNALSEAVHVTRRHRQRDTHLHASTSNTRVRHGDGAGLGHRHHVHLLRPAESKVEVVDAEPGRSGHGQHPLGRGLLHPRHARVPPLLRPLAHLLLQRRRHRRARREQPRDAPGGHLVRPRPRDGRATAVAQVLLRDGGRLQARALVHGEEEVAPLCRRPSGSAVAGPDEAVGGEDRRAPGRRHHATPRRLVGDRALDALQKLLGQRERGQGLVLAGILRLAQHELKVVLGHHGRHASEVHVVQAPGVRDEFPVDDGGRGDDVCSCGCGGGPCVEEVRGPCAVAGGVVDGDADREAPAAEQQRGLHGEHGAALGQVRRERGELGHLHGDGVVGDEVVDVHVVLRGGEGDGVAGAVAQLVAAVIGGRHADVAGHRVEGAEGLGEGGPETGENGGDVGVRGEAVQEDALHGREVQPLDVEEGERDGARRQCGSSCRRHQGRVDDAETLLLLLVVAGSLSCSCSCRCRCCRH
jgi:hypothetical protein